MNEVLSSWAPALASCDAIHVSAPSSNWQSLFGTLRGGGGSGGVLDARDARVHRIPFVTRRPTFSETKRAMRVLVSLYEVPLAPGDAGGSSETGAADDGASTRAHAAGDATGAEAEGTRHVEDVGAAGDEDGTESAGGGTGDEGTETRPRLSKSAKRKARERRAAAREAAAARSAAEGAAEPSPPLAPESPAEGIRQAAAQAAQASAT